MLCPLALRIHLRPSQSHGRSLKWPLNIGEPQPCDYVWSVLFPHLVLLLMYSHLASTLLRVLNTDRLFRQLSTKHQDIKRHRVLLSLCAIPRSATKTSVSDISPPPVPLTYSHHLQKPRVGPLSLRIQCISIDNGYRPLKRGSGSAMVVARQVVLGVRSKQGIRTLACQSISSMC